MLLVVVTEHAQDALGIGGCDALVDRQCLVQAGETFAGVTVPDLAVADAFQGACFLQGRADLTGDGERLVVVVAGLSAGDGAKGQLAEVVEHLGLFVPLAEFAVQP